MNKKHQANLTRIQKIKEPTHRFALKAIEENQKLVSEKREKMLQSQQLEQSKKERKDAMIDRAFDDMILTKLQLDRETQERKDLFRSQLAGDAGSQKVQAFSSFVLNPPQHPPTKVTEKERRTLLYFSNKPGLSIINFELEEEERDRDAVSLLVHRNEKFFIALFSKLASQEKKVASQADICRFMNEHGFDAKKVTQKEIAGFMKLCNDITLSKLGS